MYPHCWFQVFLILSLLRIFIRHQHRPLFEDLDQLDVLHFLLVSAPETEGAQKNIGP